MIVTHMMTAELAKPDSMGDLDVDDDTDDDEQYKSIPEVLDWDNHDDEDDEDKNDANEEEEKTSLLNEGNKEKSSPSIQLASGASHTNTQASSGNIKVSIETIIQNSLTKESSKV